MRTAEQTTAEFLAKFDALLLEFGATLEVEDRYRGYSECGEDIHVAVWVDGKWEDGIQTQEQTEIELGRYRDGK